MKLFFTKDDTLYKIMKSLEKVPKGKHIFLYIDYQNSFFSHPWWGKQIASLLQEKGITYTCICKHQKAKKYFEEHNMPYEYEAPNRILHAMHLFGMLLFNFKKFHLSVFTKKNTISYIFIAGEILGISAIIYIMYQFLVPSATALLQPAYNVEDVVYNFRYYPATSTGPQTTDATNYITVPYQIGAIQYDHSLSIPIQSLQYLSRPSSGKVVVFNRLNTTFTLKKGTQFITNDGLLFTADSSFVLPGGKHQQPSSILITLTASDKDKQGNIIGEKGNILSGSRLLIRNLNQSSILGAVYAISSNNFLGGYTKKGGEVTDEDISLVKQKLIDSITGDNKKIIVKQEFHNDDQFLLPLDNLITIDKTNFTFNAVSGNKVDSLEGKIQVTFRYPYVIWQDLMQSVAHYVGQRPSHTRQLISLQKNTATFYDTYMVGDYIVIPTKVSAVRGYDFEHDTNHIQDEIKQKIVGLSTDEAKKIVLSYPEISSVILKTSPAWSDILPTLKSRIYFRISSIQ